MRGARARITGAIKQEFFLGEPGRDQRGGRSSTPSRAVFQEHQYCGELEGDVERDRVWMTCTCGAVLVRVVAFS